MAGWGWGRGHGLRHDIGTPSGPPPPGDKLILEDDSGYILLETGDYILQE